MLKAWLKGKRPTPPATDAAAPPPAHGRVSTPFAADAVYARLKAVQACMVQADFAGALPLLEELAVCNPALVEVQTKLGICRFMLGDVEAALEPLRAATEADPKDALAHKFLASSLHKLRRLSEAVPVALTAAALNPEDVQVLVLVASLCSIAGEWGEAAKYANLALAIKPDSVEALQQLDIISTNSTWLRSTYESSPKIAAARRRVCTQMQAAHRKKPLPPASLARLLGMLEGSRETFATALALARASQDFEPMTTELADQLSSIFWSAGDTASSERFREFCYAEDPTAMPFRFTLANVWLMRGPKHWAESWLWLDSAQYETRPTAYVRDVPRWSGQRVGKKKILVYQDQGAGDAIMCFRFLNRLAERGIRYDLYVQPILADLAAQVKGHERLFRGATLPTAQEHDCELAVPMFALINALALGPDDIQHPRPLTLDAGLGEALRAVVRDLPGVRVGLVYGGNPLRRDDWLRTPSLALAQQLAGVAGISWVNLMFDARPEKAPLLADLKMIDPMPSVRNFADTAAIISELDAVVAVDSSVAHVAACLGKPVWVLAPCFHDWRWQIGAALSPWWPTARVLRSEGPGRFDAVFPRLLAELAEYVGAHPRNVRTGSSSAGISG